MSHNGLLVTIDLLSGHNICASDVDVSIDKVEGTSQVYCVFSMNDEEWKSQVINDLNPVWNEAFSFTLSALDIPYNQVISLQVFDQDKYTSDDSLGNAKFVLTKAAMESRDVIDTTLVLEGVQSGEIKISISFEEAEEGAKKVNLKAKKQHKNKEKGISYAPLQGSVFPPSDYLENENEKEASLPNFHPEIEFTYGYSGKDNRDNVFYNADGNLVYFTGQLGIVYDLRTKQQQLFTGHNDDILSLAMHPRGVSVATGQVPTLKGSRKPKICIWNSKNPEKSMTIEDFHTHGIHTIKFSSSGNYLLSIGSDSNNTMVYSEWKSKRQIATISGGKAKIEGCAFHPSDDNKFVTFGDKHIMFWELADGRLSAKKGIFGKIEANSIISAFYLDDDTVITGDSAGLILVWKNRSIGNAMKYHKGPVGSIQPFMDGIISGSHDNKLTYWTLDQESGKYKIVKSSTTTFQTNAIAVSGNELCIGTATNGIFMIENFLEESEPLHLTQSHTDEMWGLSVSSSNFFLSSSYDGSVVMIDYQDRTILNHAFFDEKIFCIDLNSSDDTFAVGLESGKVLIVSLDNFETKQVLDGSDFRVSCIKYSAGNRLAVARKNQIDIYTLQGDEMVLTGSCIGHSGVITHMTWSEDEDVIQSDSNSYEHLYWNLEDLTQITESSLLRDISWYKWSSLLGWPVIGIWPEGADGTDINTVRFSNSQEFVITGDDDNFLKLFNYPVNTPSAPFHLGTGHCSHVTNCSFTPDDTNIISLGGASSTIIQWCLDDSPIEETKQPKQKSQTPKPKTKGKPKIRPTRPRRETVEPQVKKNPLILKLDDLLNTGKINEDTHSVATAILTDTKKEKLKAALTQMGKSDSSKTTTATSIMNILDQ